MFDWILSDVLRKLSREVITRALEIINKELFW